MTLPIWSYWVGPCQPWIDLCLRSLGRHNPEARILDDSVWDSLYDGPVSRETVRRQAPNVQSDYLRAWLLVTHGGIWVDADGICFRPLAAALEEYLGDADCVAYRKARMMSAVLACRPGSRIAGEYFAEMVRRLQAPPATAVTCSARVPGGQLTTLALGPHVLRRAIRVTGVHCATVPTYLVHPLQDYRFGPCNMLGQKAGTWAADPDALMCMLTHRALGRAAGASASHLLTAPTVLGDLFRRALGADAAAVATAVHRRDKPVKVLIGVLSADANAGRRRLCRDTWLRELERLGCPAWFLRGRDAAAEPQTLALDCPEGRDNLSLKTRAFCRWALGNPQWDYLFKCDDDTLIQPARFAECLASLQDDYVGGKWRPESDYASGGAGYFLSRRAAEVIASAELPAVWAEDRVVGETLAAAGIRLTPDARFLSAARPGWRRRRPEWITVHGIREPPRWLDVWRIACAGVQPACGRPAKNTAACP
jgi:hypothetical protein